jgi:hypothetical protein
MTIQVEISPETEAWLAAEAASQSMDVPTFAASLLEQGQAPLGLRLSRSRTTQSRPQRTGGQKSLAQLFAESPLRV